VPSAGTGTRAGARVPKQYVVVAGRPLIAHTLAALAGVARLDSIVVVVAPDDGHFEHAVGAERPPALAVVRCGGTQRAQSVANGLDALLARGAALDDWVLVHDAARCLVRAEWVDALIDACLDDAVGGLLALPVADTLKAERGGRVAGTVDRRALWQAQTPQMFRIGLLRSALAAAPAEVTDEAGAIEALGHSPRLVAGRIDNFKVTQAADFALVERLLGGPAEPRREGAA
jgi:2-C-methyl-D-erythritol 4-phosphate cytidylyltransferase